jgi:tetratricopeptide (TPR) repeat protein
VTRLVGRGVELSAILDSLRQCNDAGPAVVAIHGPGGVGKSALAVAAGHRAAQLFPDGQLYVDLQGAAPALAPLVVSDVVGRFLRALGVPAALVPAAEAEAVSLYRSLLAHRRVLIVADNANSAEQFGALLPATPGSALIATSRHVLGMLDGALHVDLRPLSEADAQALLAHIAGSGRVEAEPEATATVARSCGYLPLALRIVGARLVSNPQWTVAQLARRLADQRRVLQELSAVDATLRASLELSWRELGTDDNPVDALAARTFLALGAIRLPSVSLALAATLCGTAPETVELALDRLVEVRLVERDRDHFRMHDLVRLFAAELAMGDPNRMERLRAALCWYRSAADQIGRLMRGVTRSSQGRPHTSPLPEVTDAPSAGAWLDGERANLVALVRQALLESHSVSRLAAELVNALYPAILMRGHAYEWEVLCRLVVDAADRLQTTGLVATTLKSLSMMMAIQRRVDEALECLEQALPLYWLSGDRSGEASVLEVAGTAYARVGRAEEALPYFEHALRLRSDLGERYAEGITLSNAAEAYHRLGRTQEALRCLERSLEIRHEFGDLAGAAITLLNKGEVLAQLGLTANALRTTDAAIETSRKAGDRESERRSLDLRARIRIKAGDIDAALVDCESVLVLAGTSDNATDLDDLIAALESVGQHDYAGRMRRRTAQVGSA